MIFEPKVSLTQTMHLSCLMISTISERTELSLEPHHLGVPLRASKTISEPMLCLAQTMHLSCTNTNNVSKEKEVRFHMTHIALEFHRVHPKQFLCLWHVRRKPCTYLVSRLALCPKRTETSFHLSLVT
jgi:hypothetical protein